MIILVFTSRSPFLYFSQFYINYFSVSQPLTQIDPWQYQAAEFNFRNQLKTVKKKEFSMDEEEGAGVSHHQDEDEDHDDVALFEDDGISI